MKRLFNVKWMAAALALLLMVGGSQEALAFTGGSTTTSLGRSTNFSYPSLPSLVNDPVSSITLSDAKAEVGEIVPVSLVLTQAPTGMAGFLMELSLADARVGSIVSVEFPDYGLTYEAVADGSRVRFAAADLLGLYEAGASNVTLATVNVRGLSEGTTALQLSVHQIDDDNGDPITPQVFGGTLTTS